MANIYDQHRAAFRNVEAHIVMHDGCKVATVAFKFPKDGAGRLAAYVHWFGLEMVRGSASGGGYDKRSAACAVAVRKIMGDVAHISEQSPELRAAFVEVMARDVGQTWDAALRAAGFDVLQAV